MERTIPIDDNAQIVIEPENYILQYRRKSKSQISWRTAGYFSDLISLATEYLNEAPKRADNAIKDINGIVVTIERAETRICKLISKLKQYDGRNK
ncbi:MAG: hypothetical protein COZ85_00460 [Candidatus Moranbacteria bacterium CG_4_8_14_3_um_filter_34_16]|nr:MAG: hypothetical protein COT31_03630 [Candidatus Moranbacteria bacterium CG08_land_8_20_14_0_20_34_16]PIW95331.1 MAG: hypothetical protein COZ85_00460 [Candidatus Moranbacteria bacterium CG_4_8_14_3_um_filter_34_16]